MAAKFSSWSRTTCFSGIDAPSVALNMGAASLAELLGQPVPFMRHVGCVDWSKTCQRELMSAPNPPDPSVKTRLDHLRSHGVSVSLQSLMPIITSRKAVRRSARCLVCSKRERKKTSFASSLLHGFTLPGLIV
jgi:hypothetical protein